MNMLIVGAGVIGTVYGAHIVAAEHQVSVLSHGRRTDDVTAGGLCACDVIGGRAGRRRSARWCRTPTGTTTSSWSRSEDLIALVRKHGRRATPARRLLQALFGSREHRSAEELATEVRAHAPDVHMSTVYRNLDELGQRATQSG